MRLKLISTAAFTLMEMMITIAIAAILFSAALPSIQSIIQNNRIQSYSSNLQSALAFARSEATKRSTPVSVCPAGDANLNSCGTDWTLGWIIFTNPDQNTVYANSATEILLKTESALSTTTTITTAPSTSVLTYTSQGFANTATQNVQITIKATGCTGSAGRIISINPTGRTTIANTSCP